MSPQSSTAQSSLAKNTAASAQETRVLSGIAQKLALAASNANVRALLTQTVAQSNLREKMALLKPLLEQEVSSVRLAQLLALTPEFINTVNHHPLGVDIYFPVEAHREAMLANPQQDFLIAYYDGYQDDQQEEVQFSAWDRRGNKVTLTTKTVPSIPVLVITQCEHRGDHTLPELCGEDCGGGGGGGGCTPPTHNSGDKEVFQDIRINNDHEPWIKGSPEIYVSYAFSSSGSGIKGKYTMDDVDNEGTWYTLEGHLFYWQSHYGNALIMNIWEQDGDIAKVKSVNLQGQSFTLDYFEGDDDLGYNPIGFGDPPAMSCDFVKGYYSTGDADYHIRYQAP